TWVRVVKGEVHVAAIVRKFATQAGSRAQREINALLARLQGVESEVSDIHHGFRTLSARGTESLLVFGSHEAGIDLIEEHLGSDARAMRGAPGFQMEIMEGVDHTFTPLWGQRRLRTLVTEHLVHAHGKTETVGK